MKSRVERINPYLNVRDIRKSLDYFVNVLGFNEYVETPIVGIVESNGHQIHLRISEENYTEHRVWVGVGDIEVLYEQYKGNGAIIFQEPTNYSWAYQMIIGDLDGNKLIFGSGPKVDEPFQDEIE